MQRQKSPLSDYDDSEGTGWLSGPRSSLFRSHRRIGGSRRAWLVEAEEEKRLEETTNYVVGFLHACILLPCQQVHFRVSCYWSRPSSALFFGRRDRAAIIGWRYVAIFVVTGNSAGTLGSPQKRRTLC